MHKAMKEVAMDLLFDDHFPVSERVVSEDPDYLDTCDEIENLIAKINNELTEEEYERVANLIALKEIAGGYQCLEHFHAGLICGFQMSIR